MLGMHSWYVASGFEPRYLPAETSTLKQDWGQKGRADEVLRGHFLQCLPVTTGEADPERRRDSSKETQGSVGDRPEPGLLEKLELLG